MKRLLLIAVITLCVFNNGFTQGYNLSELKAPASPGFSILGTQPSEIARPKTFEALEVNLFNSFTDDNGFLFPKNYALEFSPYWLYSHPKLTFRKYTNPNFIERINYNSSISIATLEKQSTIDTAESYTSMGLGYRTLLFSGKPKAENEKLIYSLMQSQGNIMLPLNFVRGLNRENKFDNSKKLVDAIKEKYKDHFNNNFPDLTNDERQALINNVEFYIIPYIEKINYASSQLVDSLVNTQLQKAFQDETSSYSSVANAAKKIETANMDNYGFFLEFAIGLVLDFPTNDFEFSKVPKYGIWLTPAYRTKNQKFEFIAMLRYIRNEIPTDFSDNFDFGGKIVFQKDKFSLYGEFIGRFQTVTISKVTVGDITTKSTQSKNDSKATFNIDYKISDKLIISYSIGKGFDINTEFNSSLISLVGLNFGLGGPTTNDLKGF